MDVELCDWGRDAGSYASSGSWWCVKLGGVPFASLETIGNAAEVGGWHVSRLWSTTLACMAGAVEAVYLQCDGDADVEIQGGTRHARMNAFARG